MLCQASEPVYTQIVVIYSFYHVRSYWKSHWSPSVRLPVMLLKVRQANMGENIAFTFRDRVYEDLIG